MKFDINFAGFLLALLVALSGWMAWWVDRIQKDKHLSAQKTAEAAQRAAEAAKKEYAAQRDFEHLKNNLKQMSEGIVTEFDEVKRRFNDLDKEIMRIQAYFIKPNRE